MANWLKTICTGLAAWFWLHAAALAADAPPACPPPMPTQAGSAPERDRGLLWRISRDGRSSWLYATLHVGRPAWRRFGPQVTAALRSTDVLALEIDPSDPALLAALADLQSASLLPESLQARLDQAYTRACLSRDAMATLHPVLQATTLTVMEARWLGMDPSYAMEQLLAAQSRSNGRRVVSLETVAQQRALLVPDDPVEALAVVEQSLAQLEDRSARRVIERMAQAWERGDLAALEDYAAWCECAVTEADKAAMRKLNDERNGGLATGIETQHRQGRRVFAAIGALHMTGAQSLPRLLEQRGFKVERVHFKP